MIAMRALVTSVALLSGGLDWVDRPNARESMIAAPVVETPVASVDCHMCDYYYDDPSGNDQAVYFNFGVTCNADAGPYCILCSMHPFSNQCSNEEQDFYGGRAPWPEMFDQCTEVGADPCPNAPSYHADISLGVELVKAGNAGALASLVAKSEHLYFNAERGALQAFNCTGKRVALNVPLDAETQRALTKMAALGIPSMLAPKIATALK